MQVSSSQSAINKKNILLNIFGCLCFIILPFLFFPHPHDVVGLFQNPLSVPATLRDVIGQFILVGFFYLTYFLFIPKYYDKRKYRVFIVLMIGFFLLSVFLPSLLTGHFRELSSQRPQQPEINRHNNKPPPGNLDDHSHSRPGSGPPNPPPFEPEHNNSLPVFLEEMSHHIFLFFIVLFFALMLSSNDRSREMQKEKTDAELSYLKAQINPHFLFNTLNSIYSLTILNPADASKAVIKLADMMRYVLHETNRNLVDLNEEIKYIADYIDLQKLRFGNQIQISLQLEGNTAGKFIAPLILISFVENAFKHGVNAEENSDIVIRIEAEATSLHFKVKNNKVYVQHQESGIGLQNVRERLQHLYPATHTLTIENTEQYFSVILTIQLL